MNLKKGCCIKSTDALDDSIFRNATILITELNKDGAIGFILNKPFDRKLNELAEFSAGKPFPLYTGGPVDEEHLFFIHQQPSFISDGQLVADDVYMGGNFKEAVDAIDAELLSTYDIKIFVGYCGWDAGDLEAEMEEGNWEITDATPKNIFQ